jgi:hypothetical protein
VTDAVVHLQGRQCENHCIQCRYARVPVSEISPSQWAEKLRDFSNVAFRGSEPLLWPGIYNLLRLRDEPGDELYTHLPWDQFCALRERPAQRKEIVAIFHPLNMGGHHQFVSFYERAWKLKEMGNNVRVLSRVPVVLHPETQNRTGWDPSPMGVPISFKNIPVYDYLSRGRRRKRCPVKDKQMHISPTGEMYSCEQSMLFSYISDEAVVRGTIFNDEVCEESCKLRYCSHIR